MSDLEWPFHASRAVSAVLSFLFEFITCTATGDHQYKLFMKLDVSRITERLFGECVATNTYNSLPENVVDFSLL